MIKSKFQKNKAYVTIVVLILMMVLLAIVYLYSDALLSELAIARNNKGAQAAFSLAEAGVQEAVWRIKYEPTARDTFLNSTIGTTTFYHDPALLANGSYTVTIQNSTQGVATVTAIGSYKIGTLRTARREIKVGIAQAGWEPSYLYDGAIFAAGGAGESIADIDISFASVNIYNGSLLSNRDITLKFMATVNVEKTVEAARNFTNTGPWFWLSELNCNCQILDDGDPTTPQCSDHPGCSVLTNVPKKNIPPVNFDSGPNSYKSQAIAQGQYFAKEKDFLDLIPAWSSKTFNGVVYIDAPLTLKYGRNITMNGVIAASGSINIEWGGLQINPPPGGGASGVLTQKDFIAGILGDFGGTGLVYSGDRTQFDTSVAQPINLTGGVISRRTWVTGFRAVNITLDSQVIDIVLGPSTETPVIETNHWEEEY